jgi:hypothetical protein
MNHVLPITETTKSCPRCAEEIKLRATGCRFCGADFVLTTRGYCTHCHRVVTVEGADATCPSCGHELVDPTIETELVGQVPPPPPPAPSVVPPVPPPPPTAVPIATAAPAAPTTTVAAPVGRIRRGVVATLRVQLGFQLTTAAAVALAMLPILGLAVESLRIWQRDSGFLREFRTLGPLFIVLGLLIAIAAPRRLFPITIGGSRGRAVLGGRRAWAQRIKARTGTTLLLKRSGLTVRLVLTTLLWIASGLLFQAAFGGEFDDPGVERLPGASVTVVAILIGLAGALLAIPGSSARIVEIDEEGELVEGAGATASAGAAPQGGGVLPYVLPVAAALALAGGLIVILGDSDDDATVRTTTPTIEQPSDRPDVAAPTLPAVLPGEQPGDGSTDEPITPPPATGGTDTITIVSTNAIADESSFLLDGEGRRLSLYAELRNDGTDRVRLSEARITILDAAGNVVGSRGSYTEDRVLDPGETTYLIETTPSMSYFEDETNTFPEGWATWEIDLEVEHGYEPDEWDDVPLTVSGLDVTPAGSGATATGTLTNDSATPVYGNPEVWVAVHAPDGSLLMVGWTFASTEGGVDLAVGASIPFEVDLSHEISFDGASYDAGALASPVR